VSLGLYAIPAWFLSRFLMELSGGSLWLPPEWRHTLLIVGLAFGLCCFHLARLHSRGNGEKAAALPRRAADRRQALQEQERQAAGAHRSAQRHALAWYGATLLLLCGHTVLRFTCVHPWEPSPDLVHAVFGEAPEPATIATPVYLEEGAPYRGSFLFPLGFPSSPAGEALWHDLRYQYPAEPVRDAALVHMTMRLIDVVRTDERLALAWTVILLMLAHLAVLAAASVAYGYSFSMLEEIATRLGT
jgi:hypothetical protein